MISVPIASSRAVHPDLLAPPLAANARVDVCLVGAGLAAMTAAHLLARDGHSVMVIDEGPIGGGRTGLDAAPLSSFGSLRFGELHAEHGDYGLRIAAQSHAAAIDELERIVRRERIACEFERLDAYLFGEPQWLEREFALAEHAAVEIELLRRSPAEDLGPCLHLPRQARFHPYKFLGGLARVFVREGGRIHCGVAVKAIGRESPIRVLTTSGHAIEADAVVTPGSAAASHVVHSIGLRMPRGSLPRALYCDAESGNHAALRWTGTAAGEVLAVSGTPQAADAPEDASAHYHALEAWAHGRFRKAGGLAYCLAGEVVETADSFAMMSRDRCDSESVYVAARPGQPPMASAAIASLLIKDFIDGVGMPWTEFYRSREPRPATLQRKPARSPVTP